MLVRPRPLLVEATSLELECRPHHLASGKLCCQFFCVSSSNGQLLARPFFLMVILEPLEKKGLGFETLQL